jgi:hypothetical protein
MSAVAIITPIVISSWPAMSTAVLSAAASMGFTALRETAAEGEARTEGGPREVSLELPNSGSVIGGLGRGQRLRIRRDGVVAEFRRDARGQDSVCVTGDGLSDEELRSIGQEIAGRTIQQYVLGRLKEEMSGKGMDLVEETVDENRSVRLRVRHWQN